MAAELENFKSSLPPRKRARTDEEKEQRRIERILRNRRAAHQSREKKRRYVETLETYIEKLLVTIDDYKHNNGILVSNLENKNVLKQLKPIAVLEEYNDFKFEMKNQKCPKSNSKSNKKSRDESDIEEDIEDQIDELDNTQSDYNQNVPEETPSYKIEQESLEPVDCNESNYDTSNSEYLSVFDSNQHSTNMTNHMVELNEPYTNKTYYNEFEFNYLSTDYSNQQDMINGYLSPVSNNSSENSPVNLSLYEQPSVDMFQNSNEHNSEVVV